MPPSQPRSPRKRPTDSRDARIRELETEVAELRAGRGKHGEHLFRRLGDANLVGIGFGDAAGNVSYVNDEMLRMMGYSREDLDLGRVNWASSVAPEHRERVATHLQTMRDEGQFRGLESAFVRPDGRRTPYLAAAALLDRDTGSHMSVAMDTTQMESAKVALVQAMGRKDQALAMVAHDLGSPLGAIGTALDVLDSPSTDSSAAHGVRRIMRRQLGQMTRLVGDLFAVARLAGKTFRLVRAEVDLAAIVGASAEDHRGDFVSAGVALEARVPAEPVIVLADPERITQVLANLLHNALKHSPAGSVTTVSLEPPAAPSVGPIVRVRDTGVGIAPAAIDAVFDPFVRLDPSVPGLGLGLAIVRDIVELHGGAVGIASEGLGRGTEAWVRLPAWPRGVHESAREEGR